MCIVGGQLVCFTEGGDIYRCVYLHMSLTLGTGADETTNKECTLGCFAGFIKNYQEKFNLLFPQILLQMTSSHALSQI